MFIYFRCQTRSSIVSEKRQRNLIRLPDRNSKRTAATPVCAEFNKSFKKMKDGRLEADAFNKSPFMMRTQNEGKLGKILFEVTKCNYSESGLSYWEIRRGISNTISTNVFPRVGETLRSREEAFSSGGGENRRGVSEGFF